MKSGFWSEAKQLDYFTVIPPVVRRQAFAAALTSLAIVCFNQWPALAEQADRAYLDQVHAEIKAKHYQRAMMLLQAKADKGCKYSQSLLGFMHQKGIGCSASAGEAARWFTMAAKRDFVDAQLQLGKLYRAASREVAPQAGEARYWLHRAAVNGAGEAEAMIDKMPGGAELQYKVAQLKNQARADASGSEQGIVQAWTGYANIVNTLNGAAANPGAGGNNR